MTPKEKAIALEKAGMARRKSIISISKEKMFYRIFLIILILILLLSPLLLLAKKQTEKRKVEELRDFELSQFMLSASILEATEVNTVEAKNSSVTSATENRSILETDSTLTSVDAETNSSVDSILEEDFIIPITGEEIDFLVKAVQHEVGTSADTYPNADLDYIQQLMTWTIVNRVGLPSCGYTIEEVLFSHPEHFMPKSSLKKYDAFEERSRGNVLKVLRGEVSCPTKIIYERSFPSSYALEDDLKVMESEVGPIIPYFCTTFSNAYGNRILIFAEQDEERFAEMIKNSENSAAITEPIV